MKTDTTPKTLGPDELLLVNPEPCGSCSTGIRWMRCYDDQWRCRTCVREHARSKGWDVLGEAPEPVVDTTPITTVAPDSPNELPFG